MRGPFQGVANIVRFNWPFYVLAVVAIIALLLTARFTDGYLRIAALAAAMVAALPIIVSLAVSWYVYDLSGFYELKWLNGLIGNTPEVIANLNGGFDETSGLLQTTLNPKRMLVFDFFDPAKHTEPSIRRARKAYPPFPGTQLISTQALPLNDGSADLIFAIMSAHEIRDSAERATLFMELRRCLTPDGKILVVEHVRNTANFAAYNIGAFHFHPRSAWLSTFETAGLAVEKESMVTPFVTAFFLIKNGTTS